MCQWLPSKVGWCLAIYLHSCPQGILWHICLIWHQIGESNSSGLFKKICHLQSPQNRYRELFNISDFENFFSFKNSCKSIWKNICSKLILFSFFYNGKFFSNALGKLGVIFWEIPGHPFIISGWYSSFYFGLVG